MSDDSVRYAEAVRDGAIGLFAWSRGETLETAKLKWEELSVKTKDYFIQGSRKVLEASRL